MIRIMQTQNGLYKLADEFLEKKSIDKWADLIDYKAVNLNWLILTVDVQQIGLEKQTIVTDGTVQTVSC